MVQWLMIILAYDLAILKVCFLTDDYRFYFAIFALVILE